jgi:hypothetical protein
MRGDGAGQGRLEQTVGLMVLVVIFAGVGVTSLGFPWRARLFPLLVGAAGVLLGLAEMRTTRRKLMQPDTTAAPAVVPGLASIGRYLVWLAGFFLTAALLGFVVASGVFVASFLRWEGAARWSRGLLGGATTVAFLVVVGNLFGLHWPASLFGPLRMLGII